MMAWSLRSPVEIYMLLATLASFVGNKECVPWLSRHGVSLLRGPASAYTNRLCLLSSMSLFSRPREASMLTALGWPSPGKCQNLPILTFGTYLVMPRTQPFHGDLLADWVLAECRHT